MFSSSCVFLGENLIDESVEQVISTYGLGLRYSNENILQWEVQAFPELLDVL